MEKIKLYLKQGWELMKQNRFYSFVYILGTALAISMVMILAIVYHIRTANIAPEVHRDRMLILSKLTARKGDSTTSWSWSESSLKSCIYTLETPELIAASVSSDVLYLAIGDFYVALPGTQDVYKSYLQATDANYWKMFQFNFIAGKPYTEESFQSGIKEAVLSRSMAEKLFRKVVLSDIPGKEVLINDQPFRVTGIVNDVSQSQSYAYAELWFPYTALPYSKNYADPEGIVGFFHAYLLTKQLKDSTAIRQELEQKRLADNTGKAEWKMTFPQDWLQTHKRVLVREIDYYTSYQKIMIQILFVAFLFLLVPAINLSGLTSSRMQERIGEIGIRKAFGAPTSAILRQVLTENLLLTFIGGVIGLLLSYMLINSFGSLLLNFSPYSQIEGMNLSPGMLLNFPMFFAAFFICLLLNVLSTLLPVWNTAKSPIVQSINEN